MPPCRPRVNSRNPAESPSIGVCANPSIWRIPLTFCVIAGLISPGDAGLSDRVYAGLPDRGMTKRPAHMSQLDLAINRLDAAMARLDAAVAESAVRGAKDKELLQHELTILRQTSDLLQNEARPH